MSASPGRPVSDLAVNIALCAIAGAVALSALLHSAAHAACLLQGLSRPSVSFASALGVLANPGRPAVVFGVPGLSAWLYWGLLLCGAAAATAAGVWIWRLVARARAKPRARRIRGTASWGEVTTAASSKALVKRAGRLRPSIGNPAARDVGYLLGHCQGSDVWASVEDSMLLVGPPRSGKGLHFVVNFIMDAPGAVVTTSTRPDNLTVTKDFRQRLGPVAVFDPQHLASEQPEGVRWSPIRGCEDTTTAMIRAAGLSSSVGFGGVQDSGFWEGKTREAIQCLLHAAAIDGRTPADLYRWATNPAAAADAARILASTSGAALGWADAIESMVGADPRTRDSIWQGVSLAFSSLADPRVMEAVTPRDGRGLDPADFLDNNGTLYLLATGAGAGASGPLVAALIEDITETARRKAARSPGARLDPPLLLALDEIANLATLPSLPTLMSEGGGTGITTVPVLQSMAQARSKWGQEDAESIWDAAIVKLILGGGSNSRDLQDLSSLIGERDEATDSITSDPHGLHSTQRSLRRVPILAPDQIRTIPFGQGLILLRSARPLVARLRRYTDRKDLTSI